MAREPWEAPADISNRATTGREPWMAPLSERVPVPPEERGIEPKEFARRHPSQTRRILAGAEYSVQGIPLLGNFIPRSEASRNFGRTYGTNVGGVGRLLSGGIGYGLAARGVQAGATRAMNAIGNLVSRRIGQTRINRTTPGFGGDIISQSGLGAGMTLADRETSINPPKSNDERFLAGLLGGLFGAAGPIGSRLLGPSGVGNRITVNRKTGDISNPRAWDDVMNDARARGNPADISRLIQEFDRINAIASPIEFERATLGLLNRERGRRLAEATSSQIATWAPRVIGAGIGHYFGGWPGAAMGLTGAEIGRRMITNAANTGVGRYYLGRQTSPSMAAILNALGPTGVMHNLRPEELGTGSATGR